MDLVAIPSRYRLRVKQRLAIVKFAVAEGIKPASRRFGLERKTIRRWRDRWLAAGVAGLIPRYPKERGIRLPAEIIELITHARRELEYGAPRTRIWLRRVHHRDVCLATIQRLFKRLGLGRLPRSRTRLRKPRQLKLFEKAEPGESVQVDVKVVKVAGRKAFQYTALDDCTRYRVLRLSPRQNQWSSLDFLREVKSARPFPIRQLQSTMAQSSPWSSRSPCRPLGSATATSSRDDPTRTVRSSGATAWTTRSSGAARRSTPLRPRQRR